MRITRMRQKVAVLIADRLRDRRRWALASQAYALAARLDPERPDLLVQQANMLKEAGRLAEAGAAYRQALVAQPDAADTHLQYARLLLLCGESLRAAKSYERAIELDPGEPTAAAELQQLRFTATEIRQTFDRFIRIADQRRDKGDFAGAAEGYSEALALIPDNVSALIQKANMLKDLGRYAEAREAYLTAAKLAQTDPEPQVGLGHLANCQGDKVQAQIAFETALALDPERDDARHELAMMGIVLHQEEASARRHALGAAARIAETANRILALETEAAALRASLRSLDADTSYPVGHYALYWEAHRVPEPPAAQARRIRILASGDLLPITRVHRLINACLEQDRPRWTLSVFGGGPDVAAAVARIAVADPRLEVRAANELREVIAGLEPDDLVFLPAPSAVLASHALGWLLYAVETTQAWGAVCDAVREDADSAADRWLIPVLRDAPDPVSLRYGGSADMGSLLAQAEVVRAAAAEQGSIEDLRLATALHLSVDPRLAHVPYPLVWETAGADPAQPAPAAADTVQPLDRPTPAGAVAPTADPERIAVIIPTRDNARDAADMVSSLRERASRPDLLDIVVLDNGSDRPETLELLGTMSRTGQATVHRLEAPFNWSWLNNEAARRTDAPILVFANDDMLMISSDWDRYLRDLLAFDDIGVVGALLVYKDGTIQHAGVLMGWNGSVIHDGLGVNADDAGFGGRYLRTRSASAVTGAFLALRRDLFEAVGGFDDTLLPIAYSDIDLCLKVRARGLAAVVSPAIRLFHFESKSRGRDDRGSERQARNAEERAVMTRRWGADLAEDRGLNPHWSQVTLPLRLLRWPSRERVVRHIDRTGRGQAWVWNPRPR